MRGRDARLEARRGEQAASLRSERSDAIFAIRSLRAERIADGNPGLHHRRRLRLARPAPRLLGAGRRAGKDVALPTRGDDSVRAVGDFRSVGVFKRVRGTAFARWDSRLYVLLCLAIAAACAVLAAVPVSV